jgi:hypothetical protein
MDRTTHSANDICVCADCAADRRIERLEARVRELESRLRDRADRSDVLNLQTRCHGNKQRAQQNSKQIADLWVWVARAVKP